MSNNLSEMFYGRGEPEWMIESQREVEPIERRGCVRQIRSRASYRSDPNVHTPAASTDGLMAHTRSLTSLDQSNYPATPAATRAAHVTHSPSLRNTSTFTISIPNVEFMVPMCCSKCEEKVKEELESMEGVFGVTCDQHTQRVTVTSNADPLRLLKRVKRIKKKSEFWPRGAAGSTTPIKYVNHAINPAASYNQTQGHSAGHQSHFSTHRSQAPGSLSQKAERHYSTTRSSETPLDRSHMRDIAPLPARRVPQDPEMHMRTSSYTGRRSVRPDSYHMQEMDYSSSPYYRREAHSFDTFPVSFTDSTSLPPSIPDHFRPPYAQTYETEESTPLYKYY